jgi:enoyl-CoA hydratase
LYDDYRDLKIEKRDTILVITMDNPPLNAATPRGHTELARIFEEINHDSSTNVVVLTGAGERAFSAGSDIDRVLERIRSRDHAAWNASMIEARHIVYGLLRLEKPLIGASTAMPLVSGLHWPPSATSPMVPGCRISSKTGKLPMSASD